MSIELAALAAGLLGAGLVALGLLARWLRGGGLWTNIVPFTAAALLLGAAATLVARTWVAVRPWMLRRSPAMPAGVAVAAALGVLALAIQPRAGSGIAALRAITDAPAEAQRQAIEHQVYAAYRRANLSAVARMFERARIYEAAIEEAADRFGVSAEVLMGIAATESSFYPRDSQDGGRGLFQITAPPASAVAAVRDALDGEKPDPLNQHHNALLGAATLRVYVEQMRGDPFLALLAYNIGPRNGGLQSIMQHYGATDFVTIQPYLKDLPRDYPIRVLANALSYRLWKREGTLPPYQDAGNARRVQAVGVPGMRGDLLS
ncbi:MAG TPA: transglycosylase SLT domain-containing protein [Candidatus Limnocylindria bacterium]|nr:transglycosylase SLT domain-containing protein [Candidatus Limnocylindria bacterium]